MKKEIEKASNFIKNNPGPGTYFGYCGINLVLEDFEDLVKDCLSYPEMKGVKIHLASLNMMLSNEACPSCKDSTVLQDRFEDVPLIQGVGTKLEKVAAQLNKMNGLLIIHMPHFWTSASEKMKFENFEEIRKPEVAEFLRIVVAHPQTRFLIAHAGAGSFFDQVSLKQISENQPKNVFLEVSVQEQAVYGQKMTAEDNEEIINSWKEFGIDQIVFGTDDPYVGDSSFDYINENPLLNEEEKQKIFLLNAQRLLGF